ncbi:MAG: DUF6048 family protein [Marinoscillum sp.]
MKRLLPYIFSAFLAWESLGQDQDSTSFVVKEDLSVVDSAQNVELSEDSQIVGLSFLFDYGKAALALAGFEKKYEGGATFTFFEHYYIAGEYGIATLQPENGYQNGIYKSDGKYFRVGGGYQASIDAKNNLAFGVRYGQSKFTDEGKTFQESSVQPNNTSEYGPRNSEARWVEMVITSEGRLTFNKDEPSAKINRLFYLGFHFRLRFMSSYDRYPIHDTYAVPGYGRTVNNPNPALNVYLKFKPF